MTDQSVQVKLELGHRAVIRTKPTPEGFTHDWTVYVQGQKGSNIQHFVQKVIFHLHDSFPKPKRAAKEPPYKLQESGYGSFILPIDIYFRNKEEPRQIRFDYDLFLHLNGNPPVNHVRCELLTFQNPTDDFRQKLLKAGGVIIGGSSETPALTPPPPAPMHTDLFDAPVLVDGRRKKHKHHHKEKKSKVRSGSSGLTSGSSTPSSTGGTSNQSYPKHGGKVPLGDSSSSAEKSPSKDKSGLKHPSEAAVSPAARDHVTLPVPSPAKRPADLAFSPAARCPADVISPCSSSSSSKKQRREKDSNSKDRGKGTSSGEKSSHSRKEKSRSKDSKSKSRKSSKRNHKDTDSKSSHFDSDRKSVSSNKSTSVTAPKVKLPAFEEELSTGELSEPDPFEDNINTDTANGLKTSTDKPLDKTCGRGLSALIAELGEGDCDSDSHEELLSPLSATSPPVLFPEFQDTTKQHVPVEKLPLKNSSPGIKSERFSPLPADTSHPSPAKASQSSPCSDKLIIHKVSPSDKYSIKKVSPLRLDATVVSSQEKSGKSKHDRTKKSKSDKKPKEHRSKDKENEESTSTGSSSTRERKSDITHRAEQVSTPVGIATEPDQDKDASLLPLNQIDRSKQHAPNGESLSTLLDLQERLMMMTDARLLQKIVSIIEETGNYKINDTTFDFDLYCLDRSTVQKLLGFLLHATS